jgi:hypothetical protein
MKKLIIYSGAILVIIGFNVWWNYHGKIGEGNSAANTDIKNAYIAAKAYFTDYPSGTVTFSKLTSYGFIQAEGVTLAILSGKKADLQMISLHSDGSEKYAIDSDGTVSKQK